MHLKPRHIITVCTILNQPSKQQILRVLFLCGPPQWEVIFLITIYDLYFSHINNVMYPAMVAWRQSSGLITILSLSRWFNPRLGVHDSMRVITQSTTITYFHCPKQDSNLGSVTLCSLNLQLLINPLSHHGRMNIWSTLPEMVFPFFSFKRFSFHFKSFEIFLC